MIGWNIRDKLKRLVIIQSWGDLYANTDGVEGHNMHNAK